MNLGGPELLIILAILMVIVAPIVIVVLVVMKASKPQAPAAGRRAPDPTGRYPQRWFDGRGWTPDVLDQEGRPQIDPNPVT